MAMGFTKAKSDEMLLATPGYWIFTAIFLFLGFFMFKNNKLKHHIKLLKVKVIDYLELFLYFT